MEINIWDLWAKEWENANAFFNTKGNIKTKSRLKDKWHKEFKEMCEMIEREVRNSLSTNSKNNEGENEKSKDL